MKSVQNARTATTRGLLLLMSLTLALAACSGAKQAEQMKIATASAARLQDGVVDYATEQRHWPMQIEDLKVAGDPIDGVTYGLSEGGVISIWFREGSALPGSVLRYTPNQSASGAVTWSCVSENLDAALKPANCK